MAASLDANRRLRFRATAAMVMSPFGKLSYHLRTKMQLRPAMHGWPYESALVPVMKQRTVVLGCCSS